MKTSRHRNTSRTSWCLAALLTLLTAAPLWLSQAYAKPQTKATVDITGAAHIGPVDAPVSIVKFSDFYCGTCKSVGETIRLLLTSPAYKDKVVFYYLHYPVKTAHSTALAEGAYCAQQQGKFWPFHDTVFGYHGQANQLTSATGASIATQLGLNLESFNACAQSAAAKTHVANMKAQGAALKLTGTPSIYINDTLLSTHSAFSIKTALNQALAAATPPSKAP